jgi:hypothetical protein
VDRLAGSDFLEQGFIEVPGFFALNEIPEETAHVLPGTGYADASILPRERIPVRTDTENDILFIDPVGKNFFVHSHSSFTQRHKFSNGPYNNRHERRSS